MSIYITAKASGLIVREEIQGLSNRYVPWPELVPLFRRVFPRSVQDCEDNAKRGTVNFCGTLFDIIPRTPGPGICVFGPPHINPFPDTV